MQWIPFVGQECLKSNPGLKCAEQNGYKAAGPARECYIDGIWNKDSEEDWLTEVQLPIE